MKYDANGIITFLNETALATIENLDDIDFENFGWELAQELSSAQVEDTEWESFYGSTKGVLVPDDCDYVIKIPFTGIRRKKEEPYKSFSINGFNEYCELEQFIYYSALVNGLSKFFAKTIKIGEVGNFSIYVQEKASADTWDWSDWTKKNVSSSKRIKSMVSKKEVKNTKKICKKNKVKCFNAPFMALVLKENGKETMLKLGRFVNECVNDVHMGNLGFIGKKPVIIDYSGFYE